MNLLWTACINRHCSALITICPLCDMMSQRVEKVLDIPSGNRNDEKRLIVS